MVKRAPVTSSCDVCAEAERVDALAQAVAVWTHLVETMTRLCLDERPEVRHAAVVALQRILLAADPFEFAATYWFLRFEKGILPLIANLFISLD